MKLGRKNWKKHGAASGTETRQDKNEYLFVCLFLHISRVSSKGTLENKRQSIPGLSRLSPRAFGLSLAPVTAEMEHLQDQAPSIFESISD